MRFPYINLNGVRVGRSLQKTSGGGGGSSYLLDTVSEAAFAFSHRILSSSVDPDNDILYKLYNSNTAAQEEYTYTEASDGTLLAAVIADGWCRDWHDQSGNNNLLRWSGVFAGGPKLVASGAYLTSGGYKALVFDGTAAYMEDSDLDWQSVDGTYTLVVIGEWTANQFYSAYVRQGSYGLSKSEFGIMGRSPNQANYNLATFTGALQNTFCCLTLVCTSGVIGDGYLNGVKVIDQLTVNEANIAVNGLIVGHRDAFCACKPVEIIGWPGDQSSNLSTIFADIQAAYSLDMGI